MDLYIEKMRLWAWRVAAAAAFLVAALAAAGGRGFTGVVIRTSLAWLIIYGLAWVSIKLFEQTDAGHASSGKMAEAKGSRFDVAVGLEDSVLAGNIGEPAINEEIKERGVGTYPGQVNPELAGGLDDAEKQAEIVRRMGWGEP